MQEYQRYIRLLMEQEDVLKQGKLYQLEYFHTFGEEVSRNYRLKMHQLQAQKTLEYYRSYLEEEKFVNELMVEQKVKEELKMYELDLSEITSLRDKSISILPTVIDSMLKDVFIRLLARMHPELQRKRDPEALQMWHEIEEAYMMDDLSSLLALEQEISVFENQSIKPINVEERIARVENQIRILKGNYPYLFKKILEDPSLKKAEKEKLEKEFSLLLGQMIQTQNCLEKLKSEDIAS